MRKEAKKFGITGSKAPTPYTQRAIDIFLRTKIKYEAVHLDETLGSGRAPLTARAHYLQKHLLDREFIEVSPKLALVRMAKWYGITARELRRHRNVEDGVENRVFILNRMIADYNSLPTLEIVNSELYKVAADLVIFDALLCALVGVYKTKNLLERMPAGFSPSWGKIALPREHL